MRIALVYAEVYDMARFKERRKEFPPFGVLYLAAALRERGHQPSIFAVNPYSYELDLSDYEAVGFSVASSATYGLLLDARRSSRISSQALILLGGVHVNFYPIESFVEFDVDVAAIGESEATICDILDLSETRDFEGVPGVVHRDRSGEVRITRGRPLSRDISQLPLPARDLLPREDIVLTNRLAGRDARMAHVMFSRGCPFPCTFCAAGRTRIQYRSGASARHELMHLKEMYGVDGFAIVDDNFIVNKQRVTDIADSIADLNLRWSALSRVDTVNQALLDRMALAGCIEVKFGVESGSERLLKAMRKNTTQAQIRRAVNFARAAGIEAKAFIIHGYPGENAETTEETIRFLDELGEGLTRVSLFRFVPLPGTQVYAEGRGGGIRGTHYSDDWDGDWEKFHIHDNHRHWWGSKEDYREVQRAYERLEKFIEARWGAQR